MALKACVDCGGPVSSTAKACPKCGRPPDPETSIVTKLIAGILGLGVVIAVLGNAVESWQQHWAAKEQAEIEAAMSPEERHMLQVQREREATAAQAVAQRQAEALAAAEERKSAVYACRTFIRQRLKNPDSVKWSSLGDETPAVKEPSGIYTVLMSLRATNSFGGVVPESYACKVKLQGPDWRLQSLNEVKLPGA